MTGLFVLLAVLAIPYIGFNVRRVIRDRRWAFTFWQVAKEWQERERAERLAAKRSA
jgi:hypothetical protein